MFDHEDNGGSYVEDRNHGCKHKLYEENRVYVMPLKVCEKGPKTKPDFPRPAQP